MPHQKTLINTEFSSLPEQKQSSEWVMEVAYESADREGVNHGSLASDCLGLNHPWASLEAQLVKNLPAMQET